MTMTPSRSKRIRPLLLLVVLTVAVGGCSGRQNMPMSYGYGDMFADDSDEGGSAPPPSSYRASGGGGGSVGAVQADSEVMEESISLASESRRRPGRHRVRRGPPPPPPAPAPAAMVAEEAPPEAPSEAPPTQMVPEAEPVSQNLRTEPATSEPASTTPEAQSQAAEGGDDGEPTEVDAQREQRETPLMIYEAGLTLAVNDVPEGVDAVAEFASENGGYVVRQDDNSIVIRVPAGGFREALAQLEALGDVLDRRISAQDVSETVRDLRIRLQNAEQMRDRLMELLEEAETVQESLVIERELERLNETIELIRGALNSLGERIAFSTITVNFQPVQTQQEVPNQLFRLPFSWLDELGLANLLRL